MPRFKQTAIQWDSLSWSKRLDKLYEIAESASRINDFRIFVVNEVLVPAGVVSRDNVGQARAIFNWAKTNIYYVPEAGEHLQHPMVTAKEKLGDCDDFSLFIAAASASIGLPYRFVLAGEGWESRDGKNMPEEPSHIYVEIGTPALRDMEEASKRLMVGVPYRSADATDPSHYFGKNVRMSGPLTSGYQTYIFGLVLMLGIAILSMRFAR